MTDETLKLPKSLDTGEINADRKLELIYQALTKVAEQVAQLAAGQASLTEQVAQLAIGQASLTEQVAQLAAGQTDIAHRLDKLEKGHTELARLFRYHELGVIQRLAAAEERLDDLMKPRN